MMKAVDQRFRKERMFDINKRIERYLRDLSPEVLGVRNTDLIEVLEMTPGVYNLNFHVRVDDREFIFRINIEQQSGLPKQIEYEYRVLKFLENKDIAPKAYHFDNNRDYFDFGILIEEHLKGPHLFLDKGGIQEVAELLVRLHSQKPGDLPFLIWRDPLIDTYELARDDLIGYQVRRTAKEETINLAREVLSRAETFLEGHRKLFASDSLNHTDVVCDNFLKTPQGLRLIDWEKPRVDDCSYDICCFFSNPAQLWCSEKVLTQEDREGFMAIYALSSGKKQELLLEKVAVREPLVSLHWVLWGATRLCDLEERRTAPELLEAHEEKAARYERVAQPENLEKLLELLRVS